MDVLTKWYNDRAAVTRNNFQWFQEGVSASAVSMRQRAMAAVSAVKLTEDSSPQEILNEVKNAIGQLSDIPTV